MCFHVGLFPSLMTCYLNGHGLKYNCCWMCELPINLTNQMFLASDVPCYKELASTLCLRCAVIYSLYCWHRHKSVQVVTRENTHEHLLNNRYHSSSWIWPLFALEELRSLVLSFAVCRYRLHKSSLLLAWIENSVSLVTYRQ